MNVTTWAKAPIPTPAATERESKKSYSLGDLIVQPGSRGIGWLALAAGTDGNPVGIQFEVVHGAFEGPVYALQGGIHGDEYEGQEAVRRLLSELDPAAMHGTVVGIPCLNHGAFDSAGRVSVIDSGNMNRVFPGSPTGRQTEQLADLYVRELVPAADALVDLHTGGGFGQIVPLVIIQRGYEEIATALGFAAGDELVWKGGAWGGTARSSFLAAGKPAITLEYGGGRYDNDVMLHQLESLRNILRYAGIIAGEGTLLGRYREVDATFSHAAAGGFLLALAEPGDVVPAGTEVARILGHMGEIRESIVAEEESLVVWIRRRCTTNIGDETVILGRIDAGIDVK